MRTLRNIIQEKLVINKGAQLKRSAIEEGIKDFEEKHNMDTITFESLKNNVLYNYQDDIVDGICKCFDDKLEIKFKALDDWDSSDAEKKLYSKMAICARENKERYNILYDRIIDNGFEGIVIGTYVMDLGEIIFCIHGPKEITDIRPDGFVLWQYKK